MDSELLKLLVCPKSKKKLVEAPKEILAAVNKQIKEGTCCDISGEKVTEPVQEALYEEEGGLVYLIRDNIPILIYDNAVLTPTNDPS